MKKQIPGEGRRLGRKERGKGQRGDKEVEGKIQRGVRGGGEGGGERTRNEKLDVAILHSMTKSLKNEVGESFLIYQIKEKVMDRKDRVWEGMYLHSRHKGSTRGNLKARELCFGFRCLSICLNTN